MMTSFINKKELETSAILNCAICIGGIRQWVKWSLMGDLDQLNYLNVFHFT